MSKRVTDRKWKAMVLSMGLVTAGFAGTALSDKLGAQFTTFVMAIGGILTTYGGMNVTSKWVLAKNGVVTSTEEEAEVDPAKGV